MSDFHKRYLSVILCIIGGYFLLFLTDDAATVYGHHTFCFFKLITHIPCPGCGMGRATLALLRGDIASSLHYNLLCIPFSLAVVVILLWMIVDLICQREIIYPYLTAQAHPLLTTFLFAILAINWAFNILHHI